MTTNPLPQTVSEPSFDGTRVASNGNGMEQARTQEGRQSRFAQSFSQVIGVLMRDQRFRHVRLADIEWLGLPPLMAGQVRMAHAPSGRDKFYVPVAVALWARVSAEVDKRLSEELDKPLFLKPAEWTSGDQLWLVAVAVAGDANAKATFLEHLQSKEFAGKTVKVRARNQDDKVVVTTLGNGQTTPKD
jgi:hemolysin-activating ACP:hemolysin acyltransferase